MKDFRPLFSFTLSYVEWMQSANERRYRDLLYIRCILDNKDFVINWSFQKLNKWN